VTAAANELVVALLDQSNILTAPITPPSGWVEWAGTNPSPYQWDTANRRSHLYYLVAGGSEPSSYTWTHASNATFGVIWIVQNVNTSSPVDFAAVGTTTAGQDPNASGTTSEVNVLLFSCFTYKTDAGTTTEPSGFTEVGDDVNTYGVSHKLQAAAGATGTITYDTTTNDNTITHLFGVTSEAAAAGVGQTWISGKGKFW
jgi:hypothetical protein